jgi:hypothetical protein
MFRLWRKGNIIFVFILKGTTYVVMNFGTFVCTRCSGIHRDLSFKVKGIGVCNFSEADLALLTKNGNDVNVNL